MASTDSNGKSLFHWRLTLLISLTLVITANLLVARHGRQERDSRPEMYIARAESALNRGDYPSALAAWDEAYERGADSAVVQKVLGDIHHRMGNWQQSVAAYEKALEIGTESVGVRLNLMTALIELQQYRRVTELGEGFAEKGFENPHFAHYIAIAYYRAKNYNASIPWFRLALGSFSTDLYLLEQLMQSYERTGNDALAQGVRETIDEVQRSFQGAQSDTQP